MGDRVRFIGIDPGLGGAVVVLSDSVIESVHRTPTIAIGKGARRQFNVTAMRSILEAVEPHEVMVGIEKVASMPRDGRAGAFRFGQGYGIWLGLLSGLRLPHVEIPPQRWQARMLAGHPRGPHTKTSAVAAFSSLFPNMPLVRKADWGIADAGLIAEYARRVHFGEHL